MSQITLHATYGGYIWMPQCVCAKSGQWILGDGPFQEDGSLRDVVLSKIVNDGDFQSASIADGVVEVRRQFLSGTRTRFFPLAMFKSISDCFADEGMTDRILTAAFGEYGE